MQVLWRCGPASVKDVQEALSKRRAYTTVLTLLRILEEKGYVRHAEHPSKPRAYLYAARTQRQATRRQHLRAFLARLFDNDAAALASGLIQDEQLSADDLHRLRALIDDKLSARKGEGGT